MTRAADDEPSVADIRHAREIIADATCRTPLLFSPTLSKRFGVQVQMKLETIQPTGTFKIRGATNKLASLNADERARGVVAISSGNHGRGVAEAARRLGVRAIVCMGSLVPQNKIDAIRRLGAQTHIIGESQDAADVEAQRLIREQGLVEAHPFDDRHVIAGQGTIGLELLEDDPELDTVVVPLSGGGLIAGIAIAVKSVRPDIRVIGVSMRRGAAMIESLRAGRPVPVKELTTLADALGGGIGLDNRLTFHLVRELVDETVTVSEEEIAEGMRHLFWSEQLVVEGAGAVGVSAMLAGKIPTLGQRVAIVVSGRNTDMNDFMTVVGNTHAV